MKKSIKLSIFHAVLSLALLLVSGPPAAAAEPLIGATELQDLARNASTSAEHATVAKHYRMRAESFEAKAKAHDETAKELKSTPLPPMAHKWPSMVNRPWEREERLAMQARRAAQESLALAGRHLQLSVEKLAAE